MIEDLNYIPDHEGYYSGNESKKMQAMAAKMPPVGIEINVDAIKELTLIPENYMRTILYTRRLRDDNAYYWMGRLQGRHKSRQVIKRLKKCHTFQRQTKQEN